MRQSRLNREFAQEQHRRVTRSIGPDALPDPVIERILKAIENAGMELTEPDRDTIAGVLAQELYEARRGRKLGVSLEHGPPKKRLDSGGGMADKDH